jgi:hypothetical protein
MGFSGVILLQQYAVLYPTREVLVAGLALGFLFGGVLIPSLSRRIAVRRINRAISRVERARQAGVPATTPPGAAAPE